MIKKLRIKFIVLSMVAVFVLIAIVVAGMNIINYRAVVKEAEDTLSYLAKTKGTFPDMGPGFQPGAYPQNEFDDDVRDEVLNYFVDKIYV